MTSVAVWMLLAVNANNSYPFVVTNTVFNSSALCVTYADNHSKGAGKLVPNVGNASIWVLIVHLRAPGRPALDAPIHAYYDQVTCEKWKNLGPAMTADAEADVAAHGNPAPKGEQLTYTCESADLN